MSVNGYDFIIVGGGSAGCVLANRLSRDPNVRVLLLEAGGSDWHPLIHMPIGFAMMTTGPHTWGFRTDPQVHANNREIPYAQARILGGGSSINALIYTRGNPADFDRWAQDEGCLGWSYDEVLPYFLRAEGNTTFSGSSHGTLGPLSVSAIPDPQRLTCAFVQSCQEFGIPFNPDFNGTTQAGCGFYQTTTRNKRRCSAVDAYLRPIRKRPNLRIHTRCQVRRIRFRNSTAVGVDYIRGSTLESAESSGEVLVAAGAIGSPTLLMHSGIGPADHLRAHGIAVVRDLAGVGANLNDHFGIDIVASLRERSSLDKYRSWHLACAAAVQYGLFRSGPISSNVVEGGAFWFAEPGGQIPDLQFHFLAGAGAEAGVPGVPAGHAGITLNSYCLRPKARGSVRLRSADPADMPRIDPNFLGHEEDVKTAVEGVRSSCEIFSQGSLRQHIEKRNFPTADVRSTSEFEAYARTYGRTSYHPVGTCKMGVDSTAVVDPQLRIHGLENIRICDSSIMPSLIGSNTNAVTIMIAEKASDLIGGNHQ